MQSEKPHQVIQETFPAPELLREGTLAIKLDMSDEQLARLRKNGLAPPHLEISTGKRSLIRYSVQAVNQWLAERDSRVIEVAA